MWIRTQNGRGIVRVDHFEMVEVGTRSVEIVGRVNGEGVPLGTYGPKQAGAVMLEIWLEIGLERGYAMPKRREEEAE